MALFQYVGRPPDSDATVVPKSYADADNAATAVSNAYIDSQVAVQGNDLVSAAFVDQAVANYATQSAVNSALGVYAPNSRLGAAGGIAQADSSGLIPSAQLPTLVTNRLALTYNIATFGTNYIGSNSYNATTTNVGEYVMASLPIPDPGYPWFPFAFAYLSAQSGGTPSGSRFVGNGNAGLLTVQPPSGVSNTVYASGVCTDSPVTNWYQVLPHATASNPGSPVTPLNNPPILGPLTLNLTCCCFSGNAYTFNGPGLVYHVTVIPAVGTGALPH